MTRRVYSTDNLPEPTAFETASRLLEVAKQACDRGALNDAIEAVHAARTTLETERQFRDARKATA